MANLLFEKLAEEYPNTLILISRGLFFNAFNESAFVLSELMNYKVNKSSANTYRAGFPYDSLEKIRNVCVAERVNFIAFNGKEEVVIDEAAFEGNRFEEFCRKFDCSKVEIQDSSKKKSEADTLKKTQEVKFTPIEPSFESSEYEEFTLQKTMVLYGEGKTVENAVYKIKEQLETMIESGREIVTYSFAPVIESNINKGNRFLKGTEKQDLIELYALVVYNYRTQRRKSF